MTREEFLAAVRARLVAAGWRETEPYSGRTLWEESGWSAGAPRYDLLEAGRIQLHYDTRDAARDEKGRNER